MPFRLTYFPVAATLLAAFALSGAPAQARQANPAGVLLPRYPALSPDGKTVVFSYQGDLWSAPAEGSANAQRLTAHPAYDARAQFSPDGRQIAFTSARFGASDVLVMPREGGEPRRLTHFSGGSVLQGWAGDGKHLLITQTRELQRRGPAFYTVEAGGKGGRPRPVLALRDMIGGELSPDGTRLVFARGSSDWPRRGYHGAANADIYVYTLATGKFQRITTFDGQDLWPHWLPDSKTVVYVSERDGTYNLWRQGVDSSKATQITHYRGDGVRWPGLAAGGGRAVYEVGSGLATVALNTPNAAPQPVPVQVAADDKVNAVETQTLTSGASEISVSPDGEQIAFVARGNIFVTTRTGGKAIRLTDDPTRDSDMAWSADSKTLVYVSHRDGNAELYAATSTDGDEPRLSRSLKRATRRLTNTPNLRESGPQFSPDGKKLAYLRGVGELVVVDAAALLGTVKGEAGPGATVTRGLTVSGYEWSPDGKWITFAAEDAEFNSEIYVAPADGSRPAVNISKHPRNDITPTWSPDGTKIFWASERLDRQYDLYYVYLRREDDERTPEEWARLRERRATRPAATTPTPTGGAAPAPARPSPPTSGDEADEQQGGGRRQRGGGTAGAGGAAPPTGVADAPPAPAVGPRPPVTVQIDFDRIDERVRRLTTLPGNETGPIAASGGEGRTTLAFGASPTGAGEVDLLDFVDGSPRPPAPRRVAAGGGSIQWAGRILWLLDGGSIAGFNTLDPAATLAPIVFVARYSYDRRAQQLAVFDEAWATLNDNFYDPHFHGADWAALRAKYRPLAAAASDPNDFYDVIRLLMGHLNSSHIGITPPPADRADSVQTGSLGVIWDEAYAGPGLRIKSVIADGPADRTISRLKPGEIILTINNTTLTPDTDPDELLADTTGERTPLTVQGTDGARREMLIVPTSYVRLRTLLYDAWVEERRQLTHKLSDGKLAYLHIQAMDKGSQDKFEQGLYAEAHGREGLLIDVRDNGGGSTADYLLTMLTIPQHAFTIGREGSGGYPQDRLPLYPWNRPAALLINQNSYSNAEIFAHAFKTIGRGPVVGVPTFGAVISTGARTLLDGSSIRTPGRGWYNINTGVNEEHTAAAPDTLVALTPDDEIAGRDPQLEAAVKVLLGKAKPLALPAPQPAR